LPHGALTAVIASCAEVLWWSVSIGACRNTIRTVHFVTMDTIISFSCAFSHLQLFRQRLSHKSVVAYATMPIGIMGRKSLALID